MTAVPQTFLKLPEVCTLVKKSRASVYRAIASGKFPAPVKTGPRSIVFTAESIAQWQQDCINASKAA